MKNLNDEQIKRAWDWIEDHAYTLLNATNPHDKSVLRKDFEKHINMELTFKAIPRLLEMIEPSNRALEYIRKLADELEDKGFDVDAKIVREKLAIMEGEPVAMATMDDEVDDELRKFADEWDESMYRSDAIIAGAKWERARILKNAIDVDKGYFINEPKMGDHIGSKLFNDHFSSTFEHSKRCPPIEIGDKIKLLVLKQ